MTLEEIALRFGTPAYVYDLSAVRRARALLGGALPAGNELYYALKANPHPRVVATLTAAGCGAEVSSRGELDLALAEGVDPARVVFTGPAKAPAEIAHALEAGVAWISAESALELAAIDAAAAAAGRSARCLLRVNPAGDLREAGLAMTGGASQFGVDAAHVLAEPAAFAYPHVELCGLHLYVGSNIGSPEALLKAFELSLAGVPALVEALGMELEMLDLGGGFAHPYACNGDPEHLRDLATPLARLIGSTLGAASPGARPRIAFESGRYLSGSCGTLLTSVRDVKWSRGRRFVVLDSGINHLGGMHGLRRLRRLRPDLIGGEDRGEPAPADVVGPLCTPLDAWGRDVSLPPVEPGDLLSVPNVGAYGLTASLVAFLGHELPVEVVLDGGDLVEATRQKLTRHVVMGEGNGAPPSARRRDYAYG